MSQIVAQPVQTQALTALRFFLNSVLPSGSAQVNGGISGSTLTVSTVTAGSLGIGDAVLGDRVEAGTFILSFGTGTGGTGTYTLSQSQSSAIPPGSQFWTGVPVILAQVNRVAEPKQGDFVLMTPLMRTRLSTNIDTFNDTAFVGSIAGNVLTVTQLTLGALRVGQTIFGSGVVTGTRVLAFATGTGGVGTYIVTPSQTVSSMAMASGQIALMQPTEFMVQLDVHGPNAGDLCQTITTMFRDPVGVELFQASGFDVTPLTISDPRQIPFINDSQQYENRWVIDVNVQINPALNKPQQFADQLVATPIAADTEFPA